jgi:hypothetical protein
MYGFAVFYAICLVLNWWFYLRRQCVREEPLIDRNYALHSAHSNERITETTL